MKEIIQNIKHQTEDLNPIQKAIVYLVLAFVICNSAAIIIGLVVNGVPNY